MDELISKKAVIEAIDKARANVGHNLERSIGKSIIEILDEVGRDVNRLQHAEPEPCEDAVSRQTLKDGFTEMCNLICPYTKKQRHVMCGSCLMGTAFDVLEATPSVTPKQRTGKWIRLDMHAHLADGYCHLWEKRNITDDDYPERRTDEA